MDRMTRELSKEEYDRLKNLPYKDCDDELAERLPRYLVQGYGYYGHRLFEMGGKYFAEFTFGSSCD